MALCWQFKLFSNKSELLHFKKGIYKLKRKLVDNILAIGISPFLMNVCACIIVIFINNQLVRFGGDLSVGAYGIANGIAMVFIMFVLGVNQGMQPIAGYNYGAQKIDRLMRVLNLSILAATAIMVTGWLIAMFLPYYCARLFTTDKTLIDLGIKAIRVVMVCFRHRIPDGHHQFLPVHRKGKDQHLPLPVETVAHPPAASGIPADNMGYRRRMVQYAYLRFLGCSHCRSRDDEIHEQAEENAQGEREVKKSRS